MPTHWIQYPSSAYTPTLPITDDLRIWLEAESLGLGDGVTVDVWTDLSGNGLNMNKASGASPAYAAGAINGLAAVNFDGTVDLFSRAATSMSPSTGRWTVFAVAVTNTTAAGVRLLLNGDDASGARGSQFMRLNGATSQAIANNVAVDSGPAVAAGTWFVFEVVRTATAVEVFIDGVSGGSTAAAGPNEPADRLTLGAFDNGTLRWNGDVAEVVGFSADLSSADRGTIRTHLQDKYGL